MTGEILPGVNPKTFKLPTPAIEAIRAEMGRSYATPAQIATAIAAAIRDGGTSPSTAPAAVKAAIAKLDDQNPAKWILAIAADSTADEGDEWPAGVREAFAALWPERAVAERRFNKSTDEYVPQVVWQNGTGSAGTAVIAPPSTEDTVTITNKVVFSDDFRRNSDDVVGSSPQTGGTWQGPAGQHRVFMNTATEGVLEGLPGRTDINQRNHAATLTHATGADGVWGTLIRLTTRTDGNRTDIYGPLVSSTGSAVYLRLAYGITSSTHLLELVSRVGSTERVIATFPAGTLAENTADQIIEARIEIQGTDTIVATLGTRKVSGTVTAAELAAWAGWDRVQFASTDPRFRLDHFVAIKSIITVVPGQTDPIDNTPGVGLQAAVYNGAIAGSVISAQLERLAKLYPVRPDLLLIGHGLNYATTTPSDFLAEIQAFVDAFLVLHPGVPVGILTQNPRYQVDGAPTDRVPAHKARQDAIAGYAAAKGWLYIDTFSAFAVLPDGGRSYVDTDGVHPNASGRALQRGIVSAAITSISRRGGASEPGFLQLERIPNYPYRLRVKS
jgi:lysophospholipase L1-like esterase